MSLKDAINKGEFVFRFSGLNKLAQPARTDVIMEKNVAMPETHTNTDKVGGVCINEATEKVATVEKEVAPLKTEPKKAMGRKAKVEAKADEKRPKARQRAEKPSPTTILIKDLSEKPKKPKKSKKEQTQEAVKEIIASS
jgi:hypothetical protein